MGEVLSVRNVSIVFSSVGKNGSRLDFQSGTCTRSGNQELNPHKTTIKYNTLIINNKYLDIL